MHILCLYFRLFSTFLCDNQNEYKLSEYACASEWSVSTGLQSQLRFIRIQVCGKRLIIKRRHRYRPIITQFSGLTCSCISYNCAAECTITACIVCVLFLSLLLLLPLMFLVHHFYDNIPWRHRHMRDFISDIEMK